MIRIKPDGNGRLTQWDLNRKVMVSGIPDETGFEVHFESKEDKHGAYVLPLVFKDGEMYAEVPNILLTYSGMIRVFVFDGNKAVFNWQCPVLGREKPDDYVYTETEVLRFESKEDLTNKVGEITEENTDDTHYPTTGAVAKAIGDANDVFCVEISGDGTESSPFVANKSYDEILAAYDNGKIVICMIEMMGGRFDATAIYHDSGWHFIQFAARHKSKTTDNHNQFITVEIDADNQISVTIEDETAIYQYDMPTERGVPYVDDAFYQRLQSGAISGIIAYKYLGNVYIGCGTKQYITSLGKSYYCFTSESGCRWYIDSEVPPGAHHRCVSFFGADVSLNITDAKVGNILAVEEVGNQQQPTKWKVVDNTPFNVRLTRDRGSIYSNHTLKEIFDAYMDGRKIDFFLYDYMGTLSKVQWTSTGIYTIACYIYPHDAGNTQWLSNVTCYLEGNASFTGPWLQIDHSSIPMNDDDVVSALASADMVDVWITCAGMVFSDAHENAFLA